jgi:hypothetical protein
MNVDWKGWPCRACSETSEGPWRLVADEPNPCTTREAWTPGADAGEKIQAHEEGGPMTHKELEAKVAELDAQIAKLELWVSGGLNRLDEAEDDLADLRGRAQNEIVVVKARVKDLEERRGLKPTFFADEEKS